MNRALRINFAALALIALAAALGGCGRAGPLEPPPDAQAVAKQTSETDNAGVPQPHPKPKPIEPPKQPFLLDPLL